MTHTLERRLQSLEQATSAVSEPREAILARILARLDRLARREAADGASGYEAADVPRRLSALCTAARHAAQHEQRQGRGR